MSSTYIKLDVLKVDRPSPADRELLSWCQDPRVKAKKGGNKQRIMIKSFVPCQSCRLEERDFTQRGVVRQQPAALRQFGSLSAFQT